MKFTIEEVRGLMSGLYIPADMATDETHAEYLTRKINSATAECDELEHHYNNLWDEAERLRAKLSDTEEKLAMQEPEAKQHVQRIKVAQRIMQACSAAGLSQSIAWWCGMSYLRDTWEQQNGLR